jgi:hypothetical protein
MAANRLTIPIGRRLMRQLRGVAFTLGAIGLAALVGACSSSSDLSAPKGSLALAMGATAAPVADTLESVPAEPDDALAYLTTAVITIAGIEARIADGTWVPVNVGPPSEVDLIAVMHAGNGAALPADRLPAGDYDALTLRITQLRLSLKDDTKLVIAPPGRGWTVQIPVNFSVAAGRSTVVRLSLRCASSFSFLDGQFEFDPDIEIEGVDIGDILLFPSEIQRGQQPLC